jgi:hypothetical protein
MSDDDRERSEEAEADTSDDQDDTGTPLGDNLGIYIPSKDEDADEDDPGFEVKIDFGTFLIGFFQTGMMNLGRIEHPETGATIKDMEAAKHNVDILALLEEKTEGNLSEEEENLIERLLYDLRMAYMQEKKDKN